MVLTPTSARTGYGSSSPETPNLGAQTADAKAEASPVGPVSLDDTQESLAELENPVDDLPPRDCHRLARSRIQDVLAMEVQAAAWAAWKRPGIDPTHALERNRLPSWRNHGLNIAFGSWLLFGLRKPLSAANAC
jgi:hypothetical protein